MADTNHSNRVPFSGGPKAALASRGAETLKRVLARLSGATRSGARR